MVKSLHPIQELADHLGEVDGHYVRLVRGTVADDEGTIQPKVNGNVPAVDPLEATIAALAEPLEYPPLAAGIVPGDRVTIVLDETVPSAAAIVRGAIKSFQLAGVENEAIAVVANDARVIQSCREFCAAELSSGVRFVVHDPSDEKNLCMVGMTKGASPVVVNREIFEADVVLPIGCARVEGHGVFETLFPRFSSKAAIERYRTPMLMESATERSEQRRETAQAGRMIGAPLVIEVVPASGETISTILAGEPVAVSKGSQKLASDRWLRECPQQVDLMIATIGGGPESQVWANVGRTLAMAEHLVVEGGAVAICSNLSEPPGPSLSKLIGNPDLEKVIRRLANEHDADSWAAWQLARALQRGPVYFLSQMDEETVEDLGLAPVESIDEIIRLTSHYETFLLVEDVQNSIVKLAKGNDEFE